MYNVQNVIKSVTLKEITNYFLFKGEIILNSSEDIWDGDVMKEFVNDYNVLGNYC